MRREIASKLRRAASVLRTVMLWASLALLGQMPRNMTGKRGLADAAALIGHYDCSH